MNATPDDEFPPCPVCENSFPVRGYKGKFDAYCERCEVAFNA